MLGNWCIEMFCYTSAHWPDTLVRDIDPLHVCTLAWHTRQRHWPTTRLHTGLTHSSETLTHYRSAHWPDTLVRDIDPLHVCTLAWHTRQRHFSTSSSSSSSRTDRWVHFQQNAGLRLSVHTWIVHVIVDCHQLTRTFGGFSAQCLSKLFLKEFR